MEENVQEQTARKKQIRRFRQAIDQCKRYRRKLLGDWQINVDYRRGKPFASQSDEDRIAVPLDWSMTKDKESQLFSQAPAVRISHPPETLDPNIASWVYRFNQKINDTAPMAGIESAVNEAVVDCVNASGIGSVIVSREAITDTVNVPSIDISFYPPEIQQEIMETGMTPEGQSVTMIPTPRILDARYNISRISPADFLWPLGFTGSDFDNAPWIGRSGRISWPEAIQKFGLSDKDKNLVIGEGRTPDERIDKIVYDSERLEADLYDEVVEFSEIFYKEFQFGDGAASFSAIHHLVFVDGKPDPVIDEPWKGQQEGENGLIGALKYPIRVLTLTYITDDAIPPSDSAVGRPQVNEINKSRSQMIKQRERNIPIDWFDSGRIDPLIQHSLMRGVWKGMIPVQGVGSNIIGSIPRSGFPQDNYNFDKIAKEDFNRSVGLGVGFGELVETKAEAQAAAAAPKARGAKERARVGKFYVGIMEVLGGLLSIFEDPTVFGEGFSPEISKTLSYTILADSTVILDSNQRLDKLMQFINFTAKSGWVDIEPVLKEIAALSGLDPSQVIRSPQPKPPVEPNISLRLTGTEDMLNPLTLAFTMKSGQAPDIKMIEDAKKLIMASVMPPLPGPQTPGAGPQIDPVTGEPIEEPMPDIPQPAPPGVGSAHPDWSAMNRVNSRVVNREGEENP